MAIQLTRGACADANTHALLGAGLRNGNRNLLAAILTEKR